MANHSGILACKNPSTEQSGGLQSMGSQRDTTWQLNNKRDFFTKMKRQKLIFPSNVNVLFLKSKELKAPPPNAPTYF